LEAPMRKKSGIRRIIVLGSHGRVGASPPCGRRTGARSVRSRASEWQAALRMVGASKEAQDRGLKCPHVIVPVHRDLS